MAFWRTSTALHRDPAYNCAQPHPRTGRSGGRGPCRFTESIMMETYLPRCARLIAKSIKAALRAGLGVALAMSGLVGSGAQEPAAQSAAVEGVTYEQPKVQP